MHTHKHAQICLHGETVETLRVLIFVEYRSASYCSELRKKIFLDRAEPSAVVHRPICLDRRRGVDAWWESC